MDEATSRPEIQVQEATLAEVDSLTTILARSFHPVNSYIAKCFPDTPNMRKWFEKIYTDEINSNDCHVLIAHDSAPQSAKQVVGILCLRLMQADDLTGGFMTESALTPDHDATLLDPVIDAILQGRKQAFGPGGPFAGKKNYYLELFGVDHGYKGRGLARRLLEAAGKIADEAGVVVFVQANASAASLYAKMGFEEQGRMPLTAPDGGVYMEHFMVRHAR